MKKVLAASVMIAVAVIRLRVLVKMFLKQVMP